MRSRSLLAPALAALLALPAAAQPDLTNQLAPPGQAPDLGGAPAAPRPAPDMGRLIGKAHLSLRKSKQCKERGDLRCATRELEEVLELPFPDDPAARRFLGPVACNHVVLLKGQARWREAEEASARALARLELEGTPVTYHVMLLHSLRSEILEHLGQPERARAEQRRAEELELRLEAQR